MKLLILLILLSGFSANAADLKKVEAEYSIAIDGITQNFRAGELKTVEINGETLAVELNLADYKSFNNYGISFQVPFRTSAYLDESDDNLDIWNFDYQDSFLMLMVLKNSDFQINHSSLTTQINAIASSMNAQVSELRSFSLNDNRVKAVSVIGKLGVQDLLIEQFGFEAGEFKVLAFTYSPLIDRQTREVQKIYRDFKNKIFSTLKF